MTHVDSLVDKPLAERDYLPRDIMRADGQFWVSQADWDEAIAILRPYLMGKTESRDTAASSPLQCDPASLRSAGDENCPGRVRSADPGSTSSPAPVYGSGAVQSAAERHCGQATASQSCAPAREGDAPAPASAPTSIGQPDDYTKAFMDMMQFGQGFLQDGKHVPFGAVSAAQKTECPKLDEDAFESAFNAWRYDTDEARCDRDAALRNAIQFYLSEASVPVRESKPLGPLVESEPLGEKTEWSQPPVQPRRGPDHG